MKKLLALLLGLALLSGQARPAYAEEYDRNTVTAEYGMKLDELQQQYGGFEHRTLIHTDCGHNYEDYSRDPIPVMRDSAAWLTDGERDSEDVDSFPPDYMNQFVREPIPHYQFEAEIRFDADGSILTES